MGIILWKLNITCALPEQRPETLFTDRLSIEWGSYPRFGPARDVCDQQATAKQADLALLSR
jgi:hypothetical protein